LFLKTFLSAGSKGYIEFSLNKYMTEEELIAAVGRIAFRGGNSNIADGLKLSREILTDEAHGIRTGISKILFLITGATPANSEQLFAQVELIKAQNIRIVTVGISEQVSGGIGQHANKYLSVS